MATKRAGLIWIDPQGEQVLHVMNTATGVGAIESAVAAQSNAGLIECWEGLLESFTPAPAVATYPTVRQTAVLLFQDAIGSTARVYVPAPVAALFDHTGDTVDPTAAAGIISAAIGNLQAGSGNTVTIFKGGFLSKAPVHAQESTDVVQMINPFTSKGELIISTDTAGDYAALPYAGDGEILGAVSGLPAWVSAPVGLPLSVSESFITSNVSMASANTYYDGASVTIGAGTWLIFAGIQLGPGASVNFEVKLWDGTTVFDSGEGTTVAVGGYLHFSLYAKVVPTGSTTYKVSAASSGASQTIYATIQGNATGATNKATHLTAVKVG